MGVNCSMAAFTPDAYASMVRRRSWDSSRASCFAAASKPQPRIARSKSRVVLQRNFCSPRSSATRPRAKRRSKSISKNLDYANSYGIPFVLICGPKELEAGKVKLKDMTSGDESLLSIEDVVKKLR